MLHHSKQGINKFFIVMFAELLSSITLCKDARTKKRRIPKETITDLEARAMKQIERFGDRPKFNTRHRKQFFEKLHEAKLDFKCS
jgi:hypothetical protein